MLETMGEDIDALDAIYQCGLAQGQLCKRGEEKGADGRFLRTHRKRRSLAF